MQKTIFLFVKTCLFAQQVEELMRFRITIDVPEETIINYQQWAKGSVDLLDMANLEEYIGDVVQDQTQWEVEKSDLLDKKDLKKLQEIYRIKEKKSD